MHTHTKITDFQTSNLFDFQCKKCLKQSVLTDISRSWSLLTFTFNTAKIKHVLLSRQTATSCHIWGYRVWWTERLKQFMQTWLTSTSIRLIDGPGESGTIGSLSLLKGLVPYHTTGILLPSLQITLFFKQFSTTCLTPTHCFQALFFTQRFGRLHQEVSDNMKIRQRCYVEHTRKYAHIYIPLWKRVT